VAGLDYRQLPAPEALGPPAISSQVVQRAPEVGLQAAVDPPSASQQPLQRRLQQILAIWMAPGQQHGGTHQLPAALSEQLLQVSGGIGILHAATSSRR
jgi:hypothetical protein